MDREGYVDGTFNTNFLKLSPADKEKNLALAKTVPFSETNVNLKRYRFPKEQMTAGTIWQLLNGIRNSGLKNDALMRLQGKSIVPAEIMPCICSMTATISR